MPEISAIRPYTWLAQYYDRVFSWARSPLDVARRRILGRIISSLRSACDLGCGTGTTAVNLAEEGLVSFAVDLSPMMCRLARRKARRHRVSVQVICADMREFRLPEPVDLVICEGDALNHVPRVEDLERVVGSVAKALRPGGYFYFDVNNLSGFEGYWTGNFWIEKTGVIAVMRNGHDSRRSRAWSDIEWFIREGRLWRRFRERVEEVCWSHDEICDTLGAAGFDRLREWDAQPFFKDNPLVRPGCRTNFLARRMTG